MGHVYAVLIGRVSPSDLARNVFLGRVLRVVDQEIRALTEAKQLLVFLAGRYLALAGRFLVVVRIRRIGRKDIAERLVVVGGDESLASEFIRYPRQSIG